MKTSVIDCGTNAFRHAVFDQQLNVLKFERVPHNLAAEVYQHQRISAQSIEWFLAQIKERIALAQAQFAIPTYVFATSVFRDAANAKELVDVAQSQGIDFRIIDGLVEAKAGAVAAIHTAQLGTERAVSLDVGGGSTEIALFEHHSIVDVQSLQIGSARLRERGHSAQDHLDLLRTQSTDNTSDLIAFDPPTPQARVLLGLGGSARAIAASATQLGLNASGPYEVKIAQMHKLFELLSSMDAAQMVDQAAVDPSRTDTICHALDIILTLGAYYGTSVMRVPKASVAMGLAIMVQRNDLPQSVR